MYNGIGLTTPRGSGTNGHVQRNWALVKPRDKEKTYKNEEQLACLDTASNKQPNKEILDHERKRKIELKCAEFADILEEQGFTEEAINNKVNNYRNMLMGQGGKLDKPVDQWGRPCVTETHQVAEAQQEKNARLREAFGISEYFVDGSSFDPDRQAKEKLAKSVALQEKEKQKVIEREKEREQEKAQAARYHLVHTPSPEPPQLITKKNDIKKKKKKHRDSLSSEEPKKKKKKKNRKRDRSGKLKEKKKKKKRKKEDFSEKSSSSLENVSSSEEEKKKKNTKKEKRKTNRKNKLLSSGSSRESSPQPNKKMKFDYTLQSDQKHKTKIDKTLKKGISNYDSQSKTKSRNDETYFKTDKSGSPYAKTKNTRESRSPSRNSKERYYKEFSRSRTSTDLRKQFRSRSMERRNSRTISPDQKHIDRNSDQDSTRDKRNLSKSKSRFLERCRKSRSKSLENRIKHRNSKSMSQERMSRSDRSKSLRSRSRSINKNLKLEKYYDKKVQKITDSKRSSQLPEINRRSKSPESPLCDKKQIKSSCKKDKHPDYRDQSPIIRSHREERSSSIQLDKKRFSFRKETENEIALKKSILALLNPDPIHDSSSKFYEVNIHEITTVSNDNEKSSSDKSKTVFSNKSDFNNKGSHTSRERNNDKEVNYKSREYDSTDKMLRKYRGDRHSGRSSSENSIKQESCNKSLTPDLKSKLIKDPMNQCKSNSVTLDTRRNLKQKDITDKHSKSKKPLPVVRLRASSNEPDPSDNEVEKEEEEDDKEVKMLRLLKTDLAAKAKESLERKKEKHSSPQHVKRLIEPDLFDITVLPLKVEKEQSQECINKDEFDIEKNESVNKSGPRSNNMYSKIRKSKSRSRSSSHSSVSSKDSQRSKFSSSSSSRSPFQSRTVSRSRSRSSSSSGSTESTSTTRSRSPSIPRRHGSPSFLDRRRITRHK